MRPAAGIRSTTLTPPTDEVRQVRRKRAHARFDATLGDADAEALRERDDVNAARDGDEDAFTRLFHASHGRLLRHLVGGGSDMDEAEDVAQEALARAWRSLPAFDGRSRFYTWLYGIAQHVRLDRRRALRRRRATVAHDTLIDEALHPATSEPGPLARLLNGERRTRLESAILSLPERQRRALLERFVEETSCTDIGAVLGTTANGASMLIFRAKADLEGRLPAEWFRVPRRCA